MGNFLKLQCFGEQAGCGWKELEPLVTGILKNLLIIGMFIAAVMISYTGWILFKGMGDPSARSKARAKLINIVIGLIILFGAYFIVDLVLTQLGVKGDYRKIGI
ncbi:MAG: hypothetical protein V4686_00240 [Patescibacteria group bacterium]